MAHPRVRAGQEKESLERLVAGVADLAESLKIDAPEIPTWHKDPTLLPILQMDAMSEFLDAVGKALQKADEAATTTPAPAVKPTGATGASSKK